MNLTAEQKQIVSLIAARVQELAGTGMDDVTIFAEMADYMPGFKRLLDTSTRSEMDALCEEYTGFYRYARILERIAQEFKNDEGSQGVTGKPMNKTRRKALERIAAQLEEVKDTLNELQDEEQEAFDNLPESLQDSEKGNVMQEVIDHLSQAVNSLEEVLENVQNAIA